jgi:hypothetical protein
MATGCSNVNSETPSKHERTYKSTAVGPYAYQSAHLITIFDEQEEIWTDIELLRTNLLTTITPTTAAYQNKNKNYVPPCHIPLQLRAHRRSLSSLPWAMVDHHSKGLSPEFEAAGQRESSTQMHQLRDQGREQAQES